MNSRSLIAVVVDQHSGELAPEVAELLQAYLAENATAHAEAERIRDTLAITAEAFLRHPELSRVQPTDSISRTEPGRRRRIAPGWLATAASIMLLASLAGVGGFFAGRQNSSAVVAPAPAEAGAARPPRTDSPWARYRIASDRRSGGMQIVRINSTKSAEGTLQ